MAEHSDGDKIPKYEVKTYAPSDMTQAELAACIAIISSGDAVDPDSARRNIPRCTALAVVRLGGEIVGIGAIKPIRKGYASEVADRSGFVFSPDTPEIGYVAVDRNHRGQKLSHRIVATLLSDYPSKLFATTDSDFMKMTLKKAGFVQKGNEWMGRRGSLSLWIRD
jgi:predicted GNAT family N-acyltransferase